MAKSGTIVFKGVNFIRYPNAGCANARKYYYATARENRRNNAALLHREIWKDAHGEIPENHVVHHEDLNSLNNHIDNLVCVEHSEHSRIHQLERLNNPKTREKARLQMEAARAKAYEWHKTAEGKAYHHSRHNRKFTKICKGCDKKFEAIYIHRHRSYYCSIKCRSKCANAKARGMKFLQRMDRILEDHLVVAEPQIYNKAYL